MGGRLAIFNLDPKIGLRNNVFGKDVANFRLFQALARHGGLDEVEFLMTQQVAPEQVAAALVGDVAGAARVRTTGILSHRAPVEAGALLRGSANLEELAWFRRKVAGPGGYSLMGVIHTLGPPAIRQDLAQASIAPMHAWDALICTSPAVRDFAAGMFDEWEEYLADRMGGSRPPRPQLPVIPLGVDGDVMAAQRDRPDVRATMRAKLGIEPDDVLLLWVGRLSFFEKAFPQPMMRAAEEAARSTGCRVHFAMVGWFPNPQTEDPAYRAAAAAYAPSVTFHIVDGNDPDTVGAMWAAGDVFVSLVDNIQETFGLTPIEAMAAGLPVVVSDWDGYRFTVRDGEEGFLIPTLGGPADGLSDEVVAGHAIGLKSYQQYAGIVAQYTAVHVGRAADAIAALVRSPDLRRRMGAAGRDRVRTMLDWRVVAPHYAALAAELGAIRAKAPPIAAVASRPVKGDPFRDFAGFATQVLTLDTRLALRLGTGAADLERSLRLYFDMFAGNWRGTPAEAEAVVAFLGQVTTASARDILLRFPPERRRNVQLSLAWLAKIGVLDWLAGG